MSVFEVVDRIRQRVLTEVLDLDPIVEPLEPRAEWPQWMTRGHASSEAAGGEENQKEDLKIRVLSLNAWGLPVAPKVTERAIEIANAIQDGYEIVVLQEIWHRRERNLIIARAEQAGFHYYHYFNPAIGFPVPLGHDSFGTGLLVLSKFPIVGVLYHSFALSGRPYALHEADFVANKGVGLLRVQTPAGQIDLYVTHLIANYNALGTPGPGDLYFPHRTGQSYELARFIAATSRNNLTIVCGDFNSPSDSIELRIPKEIVQLRDAFTDMNSHDGLTFATDDNMYSIGDHPMRMDYVLYKIQAQQKGQPTWQLASSDVFKGFFTDARGEKTPLSDHFGVKAEFVFGAQRPHSCEQLALDDEASTSASGVPRSCLTTTCIYCDEVEGTRYLANSFPHSAKVLQEVQQVILDGRARAIMRRSGHLRRAGFCFFAAFFLLVGRVTFFETNWSLLAVAFLALQCLVEYILAFFFVTLECTTFTELANQVRLHLHAEQSNEAALTTISGEVELVHVGAASPETQWSGGAHSEHSASTNGDAARIKQYSDEQLAATKQLRMTQVGLTPFAIVPEQNGIEAIATSDSTRSNAPTMSLRFARAYWAAVVLVHSVVAAFFYGFAAVYWQVQRNTGAVGTAMDLGTLAHDFFVPVVVMSSLIAICHAVVVVNAILSSLRSRELVFSPDIWLAGPDKKQALAAVQLRNRDKWRLLQLLFTVYEKLKRRGLDLLQVGAVVDVGLQVFQASKLSRLVASPWINRFVTVVIVINCWLLPLMHSSFRRKRHPALERLVQHAVNSLLDFCYGISIPVAIFYPYYRNISTEGGVFPSMSKYDDTWSINADAETQQIFVTSWADFIAKMVPGFALLCHLRGMQTLLHVHRTATRREIVVMLPTNSATAAVEPTTSPTTDMQVKPPPPRGKIRRFFDFVLLCTGATVLALHIHAKVVADTAHDPGCLLELRPWGSAKYTCAVLEVSCAQKRILGDKSDMLAPLANVEAASLEGLIVSHCPALSVPPSIQLFPRLVLLKIHNSTIAEWGEDAALTKRAHPKLSRIYVSLTNMSGIPEGLMSMDFPPSVQDVEFCGTDLTTLPENVHERWSAVSRFALELSPGIDQFPLPLTKIPLRFLSLSANAIALIPDDLLVDQSYAALMLSDNPLQALPTSMGKLAQLAMFSFRGTNVSEVPSTWAASAGQKDDAPIGPIETRAADTPLCEQLALDAAADSALDLDAIAIGSFQVSCIDHMQTAFVYPLEAELAWRAVNRGE